MRAIGGILLLFQKKETEQLSNVRRPLSTYISWAQLYIRSYRSHTNSTFSVSSCQYMKTPFMENISRLQRSNCLNVLGKINLRSNVQSWHLAYSLAATNSTVMVAGGSCLQFTEFLNTSQGQIQVNAVIVIKSKPRHGKQNW